VLNIDHHDFDDPITLKDACDVVFRGAITPSTLMAEHRRGNLALEKIGRRFFVTRADLKEMRNKCRVDHPPRAPGSGFSLSVPTAMEASNDRDGSSAMARSSAAQDALQMTLQELRKPSRAT